MPWTENENDPLIPSELLVLLHYIFSPVEYESPGNWRLVAEAAVARGIFKAVIPMPTSGFTARYIMTARGKKWIEMMLMTPMPVMRWIDPREETKICD